VHLPERSFVERVGQFQQTFADEKKEKPGEQNSERELREAENFGENKSLREGLARQSFQAGGTNNAVIVFGDAFAAEALQTFRATGHGLARGVIEATLMGERLH
jgi:hypothetical protein